MGSSENSPLGGGAGEDGSLSTARKSAKSCKGCLYYSSALKASGHDPVCAGFTRQLPQVPSYIVAKPEMETMKEAHDLSYFKYACVGYSIFSNNKDKSIENPGYQAELPLCVGIEILVDRQPQPADGADPHKNGAAHPQPQVSRPAHSPSGEFLHRFQRSAGLVASGVSKNLEKAATYVKEHIDDILYPYGKRPK